MTKKITIKPFNLLLLHATSRPALYAVHSWPPAKTCSGYWRTIGQDSPSPPPIGQDCPIPPPIGQDCQQPQPCCDTIGQGSPRGAKSEERGAVGLQALLSSITNISSAGNWNNKTGGKCYKGR